MTNTVRRFAGINFVFGGLPLPWKRIFFFYICELQYFNIDQHFLLAFYWASLSKNLTQRRLTLRREEFFELKFENLRKKRISQQNHISLVGPRWIGFINKKNAKKSHDTATWRLLKFKSVGIFAISLLLKNRSFFLLFYDSPFIYNKDLSIFLFKYSKNV